MESKFKLNNITLIVYDFDGVMTNNKVILREDGLESVTVNRSDGLAIGIIKRAGIRQLIMSTEKNCIVTKRAEKLMIPVLQDVNDKRDALVKYCQGLSIDLCHVVYIGNDLNDVAVMKLVGWPLCPEDAYSEAKAASIFIIPAKGGDGVIRMLLNFIELM